MTEDGHRSQPASGPGIFPTFFMSGFECSTFRWRDGGRRDLVAETKHREHALEDYRLLRDLGIAVSREGVPWPAVERAPGAYDFSATLPFIEAMNQNRVLPIWDLCHYGYPDHADPFSEDFPERFAAYARAAAEHLVPRTPPPHFFTPINEITFFSYGGGEWGWMAPHRRSQEERERLRLTLSEAAVKGVYAIREVDPQARMVHVDPLVRVVAPKDRPDLADEASIEEREDTFIAWDIIVGIQHPELGGSPEVLDIVGPNCYSFGQMEYREGGPHVAMGPRDERILPLCDLLQVVWDRYRRPIIIGETSGLKEGRPAWLRDLMQESIAAVARGIDLQGVCLFPAIDMPNWHTGEWLHNGICDLVEDGDDLRRVPYQPYVDELRRWQQRLNHLTELPEDPLRDPVNLADVLAAAKQLHMRPDKDWA